MKILSTQSFKWLLLYLLSGCIITLAGEEEDYFDDYFYEEEYDEDESSFTTEEAVDLSVVGAVSVLGIYILYKAYASSSSSTINPKQSKKTNEKKRTTSIRGYASQADKNTMLGKLYQKKKDPQVARFLRNAQEQLDDSPCKKVEILDMTKNDCKSKKPIQWTIINGTGLKFKTKYHKHFENYLLYLSKDDKEHHIKDYDYTNAVISIWATDDDNMISFTYCNFIDRKTSSGYNIKKICLDKELEEKMEEKYKKEKFDELEVREPYYIAFSPTNKVDDLLYLHFDNGNIQLEKSHEESTSFQLEEVSRGDTYFIKKYFNRKEPSKCPYLEYSDKQKELIYGNYDMDEIDDIASTKFSIVVEKKLIDDNDDYNQNQNKCNMIVSILSSSSEPVAIQHNGKKYYIQHLLFLKEDSPNFTREIYTKWCDDEKNTPYLNSEEDIMAQNKRKDIDEKLALVGGQVVRKIGTGESYINTSCLGLVTDLMQVKKIQDDVEESESEDNEQEDNSFLKPLKESAKNFKIKKLDKNFTKKTKSYKLMAAVCSTDDERVAIKEKAKREGFKPSLLEKKLNPGDVLSWAIFQLNALFPKKLNKFKERDWVTFKNQKKKFPTIGKSKGDKDKYRFLISVSKKYHTSSKFIIRLNTKEKGVFTYLFYGFKDWERTRMEEARQGAFISIPDESKFKMPEIEIDEQLDLIDSFKGMTSRYGLITEVKENIKINVNASGVFAISEVAMMVGKGGSSAENYVIDDTFTMIVADKQHNILVEAHIAEEKFLKTL